MPDLPFSEQDLRAANVNPESGLATDYLNHFNEYLMLAELVATDLDGVDVLRDWQRVDYCSHFLHSRLAGHETAVAVYRALPVEQRTEFERTVTKLEDAIIAHRAGSQSVSIKDIAALRDQVADLISAGPTAGAHATTQDEIDALFD
ncbi:MAG: hypothetical protein KDJ19_02210 [Hyphomicrobiaceae bacterium]|nr:hypothetical protein [Hyphomicrobiaceae bacterium]MCC0023089.1 hypothetical protein [Hyphomicrobiaceae bacterium]